MDLLLSEPGSFSSKENSICFDYDLCVRNDILIEIFSFLPDCDLLQNCRLVCKNWREIIDGQSVWKLKCEKENFAIPKCSLKEVPNHFYRSVYLHQKYQRNFIINPCGEEKFDGWTFTDNSHDWFAVECPPVGCDPIPEEVGSDSCFVTSFVACSKFQKVDLWEKNFHKFLLQHDIVKLRVGEWYAARFDCGSIYRLYISLLSEDMELVDTVAFNFEEEQWAGNKWYHVTRDFENLSKVRYVRFEHGGKDSQYWAGYYGSKMTGAFVKLILK